MKDDYFRLFTISSDTNEEKLLLDLDAIMMIGVEAHPDNGDLRKVSLLFHSAPASVTITIHKDAAKKLTDGWLSRAQPEADPGPEPEADPGPEPEAS